MVALLVSLRWRQLGHQLGRNPWYIVAVVLSGLFALLLLGMLVFLLLGLRASAPETMAAVLVLLGATTMAVWWFGAILVGGDDSMAPERFALLPVRARSLLPGLVVAGATTIGGIGTGIMLVLMLMGWAVSAPALIAAIVLVPVTLATCVLGARVVSGVLAKWLAKRRTRDLVVTVGVLLVVFSGVLLNTLMAALASARDLGASLAAAAEVVAWTPLGAVFGVLSAISEGRWPVALLRLAIALATVALLWILAQKLLAQRLVAPIVESGGGSVRTGRFLDRMLPATPVGAIAARSLRYRRRDPRHLVNMIMLFAFPLIMFGAVAVQSFGPGGGFGPAVMLLPAVNALMIAMIVQMDLAYDQDALALHAYTGVSGVADREGRLLAIGIIALPVTLVLCVLASLVGGSWDLLPGSLGATLGLSLAAAGAGTWVGVFLPGRAPAPGTSPFGRGSSGGIQTMVATLIITPIALIIGGPALGFAIASLWTPWFGWLSLASGIVLGGAAVWAGIMLGGRSLDRRWPQVLADITSEA